MRVEFTNATELTNTDVDFVALVKRGANRQPFKITKGDDAVFDLYKVGRSLFKKTEPQPAIVAIMTKKNEVKPEVAKALVKAAGFEPGTIKVSKDDSDLITIAGKDKLDGAFLVKLDKNFAVAVKHTQLAKAFPGAEYAQSLSEARKSLNAAIKAAILKAETMEGARDAIQKAAEDFGTYVAMYTAAAPLAVLKAEQVLKTGTGNAEGAGATDQETGPGLGDKANGAARAKKSTFEGEDLEKDNLGGGDTAQAVKDPLMPPKNAAIGTRAAKGDAGKNGTGAGFELANEQGGDDTDDSTPSRDQDDEEIDAPPGGQVSGDNSGMPAKAKSPTSLGGANMKKADAIAAAMAALTKAHAMKDGEDGDGEISDDDSTNGAQSKLPAKAKSPTDLGGTHAAKSDKVAKGLWIKATKALGGRDGSEHKANPTDIDVRTVGASGEGSRQAASPSAMMEDPVAGMTSTTATSDDEETPATQGKPKGKTISLDGVPAKAISPTDTGGAHMAKNDGDAEGGKKGKGPKQTPEDYLSGSGAQEKDVQTLKSESVQVMQAIQALAKSVQESQAAVSKSVTDLSERVEQVAVMAKKTDAALNGTVFAETADDRQVWTQKSGEAKVPPLLDTGYSRRSA